MKKNNIFIIIFLILIFGVIIFLIFQKPLEENSVSLPQEKEEPEEELKEPEDQIVLGNGFSILIPAGWTKQEAPLGISLLVTDTVNQPQEERAQQINFVSYYAVTLDSLDDVEDLEEYEKVLKKTLLEYSPQAIFKNEKILDINANPARSFELEIKENKIEFKVLVVIIKGKGDDVWAISFNTVKADWEQNRTVFEKVAQSFLIN